MLYDCIIVANGSFPSAQLPLDYLYNAPVVIACDGAVQTLHDKGITPSAIIGDMDSIPSSLKKQYADRIHIVEDQEINDLTKSVYYARQAGYKRILILGATGLREDHTLGNISLLLEYAPLFEHIEMLSDYGRFIPILQTTTLSSSPKQQVSIFPMYPYGEISTEGLRWPINHRTLTAWWQGTLNEATGDKFTVFLSPETRVIVYMQNQN